MRIYILTLAIASSLGLAASVSAQPLCDCTTIAGSCAASANVQESFIEVSSDVAECARVDYLVDGMPFIALIVDGAERRNWDSSDGDPSVIVQSCQVCAVVSAPAASATNPPAIDNDGRPTRLIEVEPEYPAAAAAAALEGYVEIQFSVSPSGRVTLAEVVDAEPAGVFEGAALAAVTRWRYSESTGEPMVLTERVEFNLADEIFSIEAAAPIPAEPVIARLPRNNNCVREEAEFDFGPMIDVSLINACNEPLLVYSCAAGTGRLSDRWRCDNPEIAERLLRASNGEPLLPLFLDTPAGQRQFTAASRLEITRAPNGEYWWLACRLDDTECRQDGRAWIRSIDQQSTSIDPQEQTRARLARSF